MMYKATQDSENLFFRIDARQTAEGPLYRQVESIIKKIIDAGKLVPGDLIPSEPMLSSSLGVSQGTIKKAIDNLVKEKRLYRHQGKGTYVSRLDFNNSLFRFFTYGGAHGEDARIHKEPRIRKIIKANKKICNVLNLEPGALVIYIQRVGFIDGYPVTVEHSYWRSDVVPGIEKDDVHIPDLMYALVEEDYKVPVVRAEETLTANLVDIETADILGVAEGSPMIIVSRIAYTKDNRPIEYRKSVGSANKFSYKTEIR